jgi:hypothetical protein
MRNKPKVYERAEEPPAIRITKRDVRILEMVEAYRFVSREQIERLVFTQAEKDETTNKTRCPIRLRKMFDNALLGRVRWLFHAVTLPMVYYLGKEGANLLALKLGIERNKISTLTKSEKRPVISRSLLFLAHTLAINDFRIDVNLACQRIGAELVEWLNEYELGREYVNIDYDGRKRRRAVQPDGYFAIQVDGREAHFFLEMDMETTPSKRWAPKVLGLFEYRYQGKYTERFGTKSLRVLCVTPSESRKDLLMEWTEKVIPEGWLPLFWFTTEDEVKVRTVLTAPIWEVVGHKQGAKQAVFDADGEG